MSKKIKIRIFPDGHIQADILGIKGRKCTGYIKIIEDILESETIDSKYTEEYYQTQQLETENSHVQKLKEEF